MVRDLRRKNRERKPLSYWQFLAINFVIGCVLGVFVGLLAVRICDTILQKRAEGSCIAAAAEPSERLKMPAVEVLTEGAGEVSAPEVKTPDMPTPAPQLVSLGTFRATAYCPCLQCCGKTDGITATGTQATEGRTIAVDPDVIPYGTAVYIDGVEYVAEDCGGAINENRIDVFFNSHADALEFGVQMKELYIMEG